MPLEKNNSIEVLYKKLMLSYLMTFKNAFLQHTKTYQFYLTFSFEMWIRYVSLFILFLQRFKHLFNNSCHMFVTSNQLTSKTFSFLFSISKFEAKYYFVLKSILIQKCLLNKTFWLLYRDYILNLIYINPKNARHLRKNNSIMTTLRECVLA